MQVLSVYNLIKQILFKVKVPVTGNFHIGFFYYTVDPHLSAVICLEDTIAL